jgi:hypothetical protein
MASCLLLQSLENANYRRAVVRVRARVRPDRGSRIGGGTFSKKDRENI